MPADHASRCNQDQGPSPPGPEPSQYNPEQLVQRCQSTARSFGVQRQQLLTEGKILKDKILSGSESTDDPSEKMSERPDHGQILSKHAAPSPFPSYSFCACTKF